MMKTDSPDSPDIYIRPPHATEGGRVHALVRECRELELNSVYCYVLLCNHFRATSLVAELPGGLVGYLAAYHPPGHADTIFVWQVAVHPDHRGRGLAGRMLGHLVEATGAFLLEATVTPDNAASFALFESFARERGVTAERVAAYFNAMDFAPMVHDPETLMRLGPFSAIT